MNLFIPSPSENWIIDRIINEYKIHTSHEIVDDIYKCDTILLYASYLWNHFNIDVLRKKRVVTTIHHLVPQKVNLNNLRTIESFTDLFHVPNNHTEKQLLSYLPNARIQVLGYWLNNELFQKIEDFDLKFDPNSIVIGNFSRDTEGSSIFGGNYIPKWEKGPDIFVDVLELLQKRVGEKIIVRARLLGYRRQWIMREIDRRLGKGHIIDDSGINFPKIKDEDMSFAYNHVNFYWSTGKYEGGPQQVLECAHLGIPILSTDVGIASAVLHLDCICRNAQDFADKTYDYFHGIKEYPKSYNRKKVVDEFLISDMIPKYDTMMEKVFNI